ncbi:MAG: cellulose binding domain-containing protein [Butyrivibrio sp.]|nr:cellulose binding domain-containing protein [Butyrivibrio sp.]
MSGVDEGKNVIYFVGKYGTFDFDYWSCAEKKEMPPIPVTDPEPEPTPDPEHIVEPVESDMALEYQINSWGTGYTVNFKVKNEGAAVDTWTLKLAKSDVVIDSSWCVNIASEGDYYVITPMSWNSQLGTGASADFGIMGSGSIGTTVDYTFE